MQYQSKATAILLAFLCFTARVWADERIEQSYEVGDLLQPISSAFQTKSDLNADERPKTLLSAVRAVIASDGALPSQPKIDGSRLTVLTTLKEKRFVEQLLHELRFKRGIQNVIESRMFLMDEATISALDDDLRIHFAADIAATDLAPFKMSEHDFDFFLRQMMRDSGVTQVPLPRITCTNNQLAQTAFEDKSSRTSFEARPATSSDGETTALAFSLNYTPSLVGIPHVVHIQGIGVTNANEVMLYASRAPRGDHGWVVLALKVIPLIPRDRPDNFMRQ